MGETDKFWMLKAMRMYGGSFVKALGEAWECADYINNAKLVAAFPELIEQYTEIGAHLRRVDEAQKIKKTNDDCQKNR